VKEELEASKELIFDSKKTQAEPSVENTCFIVFCQLIFPETLRHVPGLQLVSKFLGLPSQSLSIARPFRVSSSLKNSACQVYLAGQRILIGTLRPCYFALSTNNHPASNNQNVRFVSVSLPTLPPTTSAYYSVIFSDQFDTSKSHGMDREPEKEPETQKENSGAETAQGGRKTEGSSVSGENSSASGGPAGAVDSVAKTAGDTVGQATDQVGQVTQGLQKTFQGLTKADTEDMSGSLKVHVKLALEVDIRIIARLKGDIAIGIL